jgi:hypothetical protein
MDKRLVYLLAGLGLVTALAPVAAAQSVAPVSSTPVGPVFNPTFEIGPPETPVQNQLEGTPLDHCFGVGHQVIWGSDTPQGQATGGQFNPYALDPSGAPDPSEADPQAAAEDVQDDPEQEARFLAGQDSCVYSDDSGYDLAWLQPAMRSQQPAHWSVDVRSGPSVDFGRTHDDDPTDTEAKLLDAPSKANHNMWQWFGSPHQAWTPNAEALTLDVEAGSIPESGSVILSLSTIPRENAEVSGYYVACDLVFSGAQLEAAQDDDGHVEASPLDANFRARQSHCSDLEQQFDSGGEEAKRDALGQVRITQLSFWGWNHGDEPAVVDDVQLEDATTVAEEGARDTAEGVAP